MEWKNFDIEEINTPSETVEKSLNGFENATKGIIGETKCKKNNRNETKFFIKKTTTFK